MAAFEQSSFDIDAFFTSDYRLVAGSSAFDDSSFDSGAFYTATNTHKVTGNNVSFVHGYLISHVNDAITLNGQSSTLSVSHQLSAEVNSFSLSGSIADFSVYTPAKEIISNTGLYSYSGSAAVTLVARRIYGSYGSFVATGRSIESSKTAYLFAGGNNFNLYGFSSEDIVDYSFRANANIYTYSGSAASLDLTHIFGAQSGNIAVTGNTAEIRQFIPYRFLNASSDNYSIFGKALTPRLFRRVFADKSAIDVTGIVAAIKFGRRFSVGYGSFLFNQYNIELFISNFSYEDNEVMRVSEESNNLLLEGQRNILDVDFEHKVMYVLPEINGAGAAIESYPRQRDAA